MEFDVSIIDNEVPEPDKVFFVRLAHNEDNPNVVLGQRKMCIVTIIDDDGM